MNRFALLLAGFLSMSAWAQVVPDTPPSFRSDAEEQRFRELTSELRCVMCQNQSLADSNAQIAHDLRREILRWEIPRWEILRREQLP